jgi:hypothetical protein
MTMERIAKASFLTFYPEKMSKVEYILSIFIIVTFLSCFELDSIEGQYSTYAEAVNSIGSWLPQWTPKAAYNINEKHNIDTNESILWFQSIVSQHN